MASPFDDIRNLVRELPQENVEYRQKTIESLSYTGTNFQPMGHLRDAVVWLAGWQARQAKIEHPICAVFIGAHGLVADLKDVDVCEGARARVEMVSNGQSAVRGIAQSIGAAFKVYEMGVDAPAMHIGNGPSLSELACTQSIAFGMQAVSEGADLIVLGNAGFGSATAAAGIARALFGGQVDYWAGGTEGNARERIELLRKAAYLHREAVDDPLEILRCFGGHDIAGMVGTILAARHQRIPVLLDGFVSCAAAAVLYALNPTGLDHCLAAHLTSEPAHQALLERIEKPTYLNFGLATGDGSGACLVAGLLKSTCKGASNFYETF